MAVNVLRWKILDCTEFSVKAVRLYLGQQVLGSRPIYVAYFPSASKNCY